MNLPHNAKGGLTDRFPGAKLIRYVHGVRVWRQRPIDHLFANHRTVAEVDAGQLVSAKNAIFIPIAAAPSAGEGGRPAMVAGGSLANVSDQIHAATANGKAVHHHA